MSSYFLAMEMKFNFYGSFSGATGTICIWCICSTCVRKWSAAKGLRCCVIVFFFLWLEVALAPLSYSTHVNIVPFARARAHMLAVVIHLLFFNVFFQQIRNLENLKKKMAKMIHIAGGELLSKETIRPWIRRTTKNRIVISLPNRLLPLMVKSWWKYFSAISSQHNAHSFHLCWLHNLFSTFFKMEHLAEHLFGAYFSPASLFVGEIRNWEHELMHWISLSPFGTAALRRISNGAFLFIKWCSTDAFRFNEFEESFSATFYTLHGIN